MVVEYLSKSWDAYRRNFWQIIGGLLLVALVTVGIILLTGMPLFINFIQYYSSSSIPSPSLAGFLMDGTAQSLIALFVAGVAVAIIAGTALEAGFVKMFADALKGSAEIGTIISVAREKFWTIIGANVLAGIIRIALFIVLVLPPFLNFLRYSLFLTYMPYAPISDITPIQLGMMLWFYGGLIIYMLLVLPFALVNQAAVVGNYKAVESIKKSFSVVKENYLQFLGLTVLVSLIALLVSLVPVLGSLAGFFVVTPVAGLAYTAFYLAKARESGRTVTAKRKTARGRKIRK